MPAQQATSMTFDNLVTTLKQYVERGSVSDETVDYQLPFIINRAERSCADRLKIQGYRFVLTSTMKIGQPVIAKPEGWRNTVSFNIGTGPNLDKRKTLRIRSYEYLRMRYPQSSMLDEPALYADYDQNHWIVGASPNQKFPFEAIVYRLPDLLCQANQTNYLTEFVPNFFLYGCLIGLEPFLKNDSRINTWKGLYDLEFNNITAQDILKMTDRGLRRNTS